MIYRDAGVAVRQALAGNRSDAEVGELHPEHFTRLELGLAPACYRRSKKVCGGVRRCEEV